MVVRPARGSDPRPREDSLLRGCRARDPAALETFYGRYADQVTRVIGRLVGPTPDLEDLVQTTFLEAIPSLTRFRGEASLGTWVTRIAVHVAYHHLRRGVRRQVPLHLMSEADEPRDPRAQADHVAHERRLAHRVHALLDRIAPRKRIAWLLYTVEGYSIEEVAALMGASRAATKSRIWFARRELLALAREDAVLGEIAADKEGGE